MIVLNNLQYLLLFLLGLSFGSFLNVLSIRYRPHRGLFHSDHIEGRSKCLSCQKTLSWYELVPIFSFIFQMGKCRSCSKSLLWQYPIVEIISAAIFVMTPYFIKSSFIFWNLSWGNWVFWVASAIWILVLMLLVLAFIIDLRHYVIPNSVSALIFVLGIIWIALGNWQGFFSSSFDGSFLRSFSGIFPVIGSFWISRLVGLLFGSVFFLLIIILSKGRAMGMGDVKLMGAVGLIFGWPDIVIIVALSFIIGLFVSLILMAFKLKKVSDRIPFGPLIVVSSFIVFFFGSGLMGLYFSIIGM